MAFLSGLFNVEFWGCKSCCLCYEAFKSAPKNLPWCAGFYLKGSVYQTCTYKTKLRPKPKSVRLLLMEEILQHQGCIKPCKYGIFTISTGAGFLPSTACPKSTPRHIHNRPLLPAAYSQTRSVKQPLQPRQSSTKKHHHGPWRSSAPLQWNLSPGCSPLRPNRNAVRSRGDRL